MTNLTEIKEKLDSQEEVYETEPPNVEQKEGLSDAFEEFERETSNINFDETRKQNGGEPAKIEISEQAQKANTNFKIKMFVTFASFVFAGINTFLLNLIRGTNVSFDDMQLDETEKESLEPYLNDPAVLEFINKIPSGVILACHVEFMFFQKHSEAVKKLKELEQENKNLKNKNNEQHEEQNNNSRE